MARRLGNRRASSKPKRTTVNKAFGRSITRKRRATVKGGTRTVARTHSNIGGTSSTKRLGSFTGKRSGKKPALRRTASLKKTTTGTGANRVARTVRTITRKRGGRTVTRKVVTTNRGGKVTRTASPVRVTGGTKRLTPRRVPTPAAGPRRTSPAAPGHRSTNGGTTAPSSRKARRRK